MAAACALAIISGKNIFNRAMPERLRTLRHCIFTRRGRKGKRQLPCLLPAEAAALRESFLFAELPQSKPDGFASSLEEGASGAHANFALEPEAVPLCQRPHLRGRLPPAGGRCRAATKRGIWHRVAMTGGVFPHTLFLHKLPAFRPNYQKKPDFLSDKSYLFKKI